MNDIDEICNKIILIDSGKIMYDGDLSNFKSNYSQGQLIEVVYNDAYAKFENKFVKLLYDDGLKKPIVSKRIIYQV